MNKKDPFAVATDKAYFISDDGTRDGAYGHKDDFGGKDIFEATDLYWDRSPLKYVRRSRHRL